MTICFRAIRINLCSGFCKPTVIDAQGQSLAYCYGRETRAEADTAAVLTMDEARRIASNIAKLPALLGAVGNPELDDFPEGGG
jgi:hypothetical protein